jgi:hypothetical protein
MTWIPRQFHLACYSSHAGDDILGEPTGEWTRIQGSPLNGLEVHDLLETEGECLFWLDVEGQLNVDPILGRLKVRFADLLAMHPQAARRAQLTPTAPPLPKSCIWRDAEASMLNKSDGVVQVQAAQGS